jgi:hypothetical protein
MWIAQLLIRGVTAMAQTSLHVPRVGDVVHYWPLPAEGSGCRAAIVTDIYMDTHLASLVVLHINGLQFLEEVRISENDTYLTDAFVDRYPPGTWHLADHQ